MRWETWCILVLAVVTWVTFDLALVNIAISWLT